MSLLDVLYHACDQVRQGAILLPEACQELIELLHQREATLRQQLQAASLPPGFDGLEEVLEEALHSCHNAVGALSLACREGSPELAGWAKEQIQDADERLRHLRQMLEDYSSMLCEESDRGDR